MPGRQQRLTWRYASNPDGTARTRLTMDRPQGNRLTRLHFAEIGELDTVRASADQSYLVTIDGEQGYRIRAWNSDTLQEQWSRDSDPQREIADYPRVQLRPEIFDLAAGGALVGDADTALLIDPTTGTVARRFVHPRSTAWEGIRERAGGGARNLVSSASFSSDRRRLLTVTHRYGGSDVWLWDAASGRMLQQFAHADANLSEQADGASLLTDGERLFTWTQYGTLRLWDVASGEELATMRQGLPIERVTFFDQDRKALVADIAGASVWNLADGEELVRVDHLRRLEGSVLSADESRILSWSEDGTARVWDAASGEELHRTYHSGRVNGAMLLRDGTQVLSWSEDGSARITDVASGSEVMVFDVAAFPAGSPLAPPLRDRPPQPAQVGYLRLATAADGPEPGESVDIYGWGKTAPIAGFVPYASLMRMELTAMDNAACAAREDMGPVTDPDTGQPVERVHANVFCAAHPQRKTCKGDSGGPVVSYRNDVLLGVVSWGKSECGATGEPGVYTRVSHYRDWIIAQIGESALPAFPDQGDGGRVIGGTAGQTTAGRAR
jgi:hypothetical protein